MSRLHRVRRRARYAAAGGILPPTITLNALSLNGTLTQGVAVSGVTITGATAGSTITLSIGGLTISGNGATRTVSGTPTASGVLTGTEVLAGATNSGRQTVVGSVVGTTFNVMDYGAVADSNGTTGSGTDNVPAFLAARDAAVAAGGGKIIVPNTGTGKFRLAAAAFAITSSNIVVEGQSFAEMYFDTSDITTFGRLIFDGGVATGEITGNGVTGNLRVTTRANVAVAGSQPGYNGSACLITFRGCANFVCTGSDTRNSANYHISLLRSRDGSVINNTGQDGTADGVHAQDGCARILIDGNTFNSMGDDIVGIGYWGAKNTDITVTNNTGTGCGACGIAIYAPTEGVTVRGNKITSTYNSGIKCAPVSKNGGASNVVKGLVIRENVITQAGMRLPAAFSRGDGVACGIHLAPSGGRLEDATVIANRIDNSRSSFIITDPTGGGSIGTLVVTDNICNGIAAAGGQGATTSKNPDGTNATGNSRSTPDTSYPGLLIGSNVGTVTESSNSVIGAVGAPVVNNAQATTVTTPASPTLTVTGGAAQNSIAWMDGNAGSSAITSRKMYRSTTAGFTPSSANLLATITAASPYVDTGLTNGTTYYYRMLATNGTGDGALSAQVSGTPVATSTVITSDDFNRADVAPAVGALGTTSVGGKTWAGAAAGISGNKATFGTTAGIYPGVSIDAGTGNFDASISIDVAANKSGRIVGRCGTDPTNGAAVLFSSDGNVGYYNGTSYYPLSGAATPMANGAHTLRLVVNGNVVSAYVDGTLYKQGQPMAGSNPVTMQVTTNVGFQNGGGSAGSPTFDNFTVSAAA